MPEVGLEQGSSPLQIRPSPENIPNPNQSDAGTTESEAEGVDTVHTLFCARFEAATQRGGTSVLEDSLSTARRRPDACHYSPKHSRYPTCGPGPRPLVRSKPMAGIH